MTGPLRLSIEITGSSAGLRPATGDARRQITEVGGAADAASRSASAMGAAFDGAGRTIVATTATAADRVRQLTATLEAASAVRFDGMGMAISATSAEIGATQAALATSLRELRAQFDPTTAATLRYEAALAEVREAHRLGAIDGALLVQREAEIKLAFERTTSAIAGRAAAAKRAAEASVASQTIVPDRGADIAAYGAELDALQAEFDPLFAATLRYQQGIERLQRAHEVGAVSIDVYRAREVELRMDLERTTSALAGRAAAAKRAAEASVASQTIVPNRGADIAAYGAELDALRAKYNPLWAAEQAHAAALADIGRAERVGALTADEASTAVWRASEAHRIHVEALKRGEAGLRSHAGAMHLSAMQATQLSYQLNDVVVSLMSGMNPLTVFVQQGSQITPIFGGVSGTLRAMTAVVNPATVSIAALALAAGVSAKAIIDWTNSMRTADTVARGVGRAAGTTAAEIDAIARSTSAAGGVSVSSAREMAVEFARTGKIGVDQFGGLIGIAKDFGATVGMDATTAAKTLATALADPAKGAQQLAESYHLLDGSQVRLIARMVEQGRVTDAQRTLFDAVRARIIPAGETVAWYSRAWDSLAQSVSNAYDAMGRGLSAGPQDVTALERQIAALEKLKARATPGSDVAVDADRDLQALRKKLDAERRLVADSRQKAAADQSNALGDAAISIAAGSGAAAVRDQLTRQKLSDDLAALKAGQAARNLTTAEEGRLGAAIEAKTRALSTWISESDRARQLAEIDLAVQATRDPVERAALERRRALVTLAGQEVTAAEADAAAQTAYARALGEVSAAARGSLADMTADVAARTRVNALVAAGSLSLADLNRELEIEAQTRQLAALAARTEGAEREKALQLIEQITRAITARDAATRRSAALQDIRAGEDRLETLRAEIALVGQSEAVRTRYLAVLETEQRIRQAGIDGTTEATRLRAQAVASGELTTALERQKSAWEEIKTAGGNAIDTIVEGLRKGKIDATTLVEDLQKEFFKLALANPLKNMVFGQNLPTMGDVGGLLGNIMGNNAPSVAAIPGLSGVGSMQVTAGVVTINGGLAGAAGLLGGLGGGLDRSGFAAELTNPTVRSKLFAMTEAEVGGQGAPAQQAFMETIFNRASARGKSLDQVLSDRGYFPSETFDRAGGLMGSSALEAKYGSVFGQVAGGSNIAGLATGNASGTVGFGGGPMTFAAGGERFGIEGADMGWARQLQASSGQASQSLASLGSSSTSAVGALGQLSSGTNQAAAALTDGSSSLAQSAAGIGSSASGLETASKDTAKSATGAFGAMFGALGTGIDGLIGSLGKLLGGIGGGGGGLFSWIGGLFGAKAAGGLITGPGSSTSDSILGAYPAGTYIVNAASTSAHRGLLEAIVSGGANDAVPTWVSNGEFAVPPSLARRNLPLLEAINRGSLPRRAAGGFVDGSRIGRMPTVSGGGAGSGRGGGAGSVGPLIGSMPMKFEFHDVSPDLEARMQTSFEQRVPGIVSQAVAEVAEAHRTQSGYMR